MTAVGGDLVAEENQPAFGTQRTQYAVWRRNVQLAEAMTRLENEVLCAFQDFIAGDLRPHSLYRELVKICASYEEDAELAHKEHDRFLAQDPSLDKPQLAE